MLLCLNEYTFKQPESYYNSREGTKSDIRFRHNMHLCYGQVSSKFCPYIVYIPPGNDNWANL